jgi:hypothetical protein
MSNLKGRMNSNLRPKTILCIISLMLLLIPLTGCQLASPMQSYTCKDGISQSGTSYSAACISHDIVKNKLENSLENTSKPESQEYTFRCKDGSQEKATIYDFACSKSDREYETRQKSSYQNSTEDSYYWGQNYCVKIPNDGDWYHCTRPDGSTYNHERYY